MSSHAKGWTSTAMAFSALVSLQPVSCKGPSSASVWKGFTLSFNASDPVGCFFSCHVQLKTISMMKNMLKFKSILRTVFTDLLEDTFFSHVLHSGFLSPKGSDLACTIVTFKKRRPCDQVVWVGSQNI